MRGSVRVRLTVLFASLFLVAGAGLLGITYGLVSNAQSGIAMVVAAGNFAPILAATVTVLLAIFLTLSGLVMQFVLRRL